nr:5'-nucleotidase [Rhodococcus sp. MS13]
MHSQVSAQPRVRRFVRRARLRRVDQTCHHCRRRDDEDRRQFAFFLGGVSKVKVLEILKPHIFFDDQTKHLLPASTVAPCVHVPFGVTNADVLRQRQSGSEDEAGKVFS